MKKFLFTAIVAALMIAGVSRVSAGDWPMWRGNAQRTASVHDALPSEKPELMWKHSFGARQQAWDSPLNNYLMQYDKNFEPIVVGSTMIVGFNDVDKVIGIHTRSGKIRWTFYCAGPVRLAPAAARGKVYFGSDDGMFYCLDAESGRKVWSYSAAPASKKLIGNRRIISMWPVRGGAVLADDTVYFSAGIWPFMGVFIYALDAETGELKWLNDHDSIRYQRQPHMPSMAFAGVAPQGAFVVNNDKLIVPGGRSLPAILDRSTGKRNRYDLAGSQKSVGGDFVATFGDVYYMRSLGINIEGSTQYSVSSGRPMIMKPIEGMPVVSHGVTYFSGKTVRAYETDENGVIKDSKTPLWCVEADASGDLIQAGDFLFAGGEKSITAINSKSHGIEWKLELDQNVVRLVAADNSLFAITDQGSIYAFGQGDPVEESVDSKAWPVPEQATALANQVLELTASRSGWAMAMGLEQLDLVRALVKSTDHNFVILDNDAEKIRQARRLIDEAGLYGKRIATHVGTPRTFDLAPYAMELIVSAKALPSADMKHLLSNLRPYGGSLILLEGDTIDPAGITSEPFDVVNRNGITVVSRSGPLPGAAAWTHNYGSIAQTAKSDDKRVKLPLGLLWWGGSSNMDVLPRHGHGPSQQVIGGRLFIQGIDCMTARDVYTGRVLWRRELPGLNQSGVYFDKSYNPKPLAVGYNQKHMPGANIRGANFVAAEDKVYLIFGKRCLVLDCATGMDLAELTLPEDAEWGYIGTTGDVLIAGAGFTEYVAPTKHSWRNLFVFNKSASKKLVAMNRHTGKILWQKTAAQGFMHNGIVVGGGKVFALDRVPKAITTTITDYPQEDPAPAIVAFDLKHGTPLWKRTDNIFGSYLAYSETHGILLHASRPSGDMTPGEKGKHITALNGDTGKMIWTHDIIYNTFPIIHNDSIISESGRWSLSTGQAVPRINPITGDEELWSWTRTYGCNYPVASEHMLTFRSGAAGFYDLEGDGGTGTFGGFKSGCSINLIAADGVLNAPDYTRTCTCAYQNQTSLALVHMPELEFWTSSTLPRPLAKVIKRIGINFGAPGDRKAGETFWVDYPSIGGSSPDPDLRVQGDVSWKLDNAARFGNTDYNWVYASCGMGLEKLSLNIGRESEASVETAYTVKLYFAEPDTVKEGERIFDILLQGTKVTSDFDIIAEAEGVRRGVVKTYKGIACLEVLELELRSLTTEKPLLSGLEVIKEES